MKEKDHPRSELTAPRTGLGWTLWRQKTDARQTSVERTHSWILRTTDNGMRKEREREKTLSHQFQFLTTVQLQRSNEIRQCWQTESQLHSRGGICSKLVMTCRANTVWRLLHDVYQFPCITGCKQVKPNWQRRVAELSQAAYLSQVSRNISKRPRSQKRLRSSNQTNQSSVAVVQSTKFNGLRLHKAYELVHRNRGSGKMF